MPTPLQPDDPNRVGPFRLGGRLAESAAGIVYLGTDGYDRRVSVALLTTAAAGDEAARDRFRAAIMAEMAPPGSGTAPGPARSRVVAAEPHGAAPWVATAFEEGRAGAERFFEPVLLRRGWGVTRRRGGPQFRPYWAAEGGAPAFRRARPLETKPLASAALSLATLLLVLAGLLVVLFTCEPHLPDPKPVVPVVPATPAPPPFRFTPGPSPSPGRTTPAPSPTFGDGGPGPGL